jgi:nicotinate-nucleotide adenylyltransferase
LRVGVFGGVFDPIHRGHVEPALAARRALGLERVLFVPTAAPPHKREPTRAPIAAPLARYAMVELALLDHPELEVSTLELSAEGPTYTIETLERLAAGRPGDEIWLLLGADALADLGGWRRGGELARRFPLGVLARPGFDAAAAAAALGGAGLRVVPVGNPPLDLSSTEIRARLARGEALPDGWLDPRVLTFLAKYRIYR